MPGFPRRALAAFAAAGAISIGAAGSASAAVPHTVQPGETLWSIAAANNLTTMTVAVFNGLAEDSIVVLGQTVQVPTVAEGAAALSAVVPEQPVASAGNAPAAAPAARAHVVARGEALSTIAAVNGLSASELGAANGRGAEDWVFEGESLAIPATATATAAPSPEPALTGPSPTAGLGHIPSPFGELHLDPAAADAWNALRDESLRAFGRDLHPAGTLSAYRTFDQQAQLYDLSLEGRGAPANPPGTSSHERGVAVDLATPEMRSVVDQIGASFGWGKVEADNEWWHVNYAP